MLHFQYRFTMFVPIVLFMVFTAGCGEKDAKRNGPGLFHAQGETTGEVTGTGAILQSRLTLYDKPVGGDIPGSPGAGAFEISVAPDFPHYIRTPWIEAREDRDYIVKYQFTGLKPGTRYYYRLVYGMHPDSLKTGEVSTFRTWPDSTVAEPVSFVVVTGMNYGFFHDGRPGKPETAYKGDDKHLGYPALETIKTMEPDFFIGTGDNVYYDHPSSTRAKTTAEMRRKWHEQFIQPRFAELFSTVPTYWMKDDHDYRYNDSDPTDEPDGPKPDDPALPTHGEGVRIFREQMPVVVYNDTIPTYRTVRINKLLQLWFVEGRDYRSANTAPDGPGKTIWGKEQLHWLKETLTASDATFKLLVSPTPMVGPDDAYKKDNHVNHDGFRHEGDAFFAWLTDNGFPDKNFYIICGDRHWQYHARHPSGFEEFSCGALVDANARLGRKPGDPESTDPDALVTQLYTQREASGGFLKVSVKPGANDEAPTAEFAFFDELGAPLYTEIKTAK